ncbi:transcriptional regulator with XRE-family HTH domain [Thermocatellispora tengchongensis]|uniref:Transcriptional regulator with XRE-family HTH domain n=1 Tax=Thermocatellispora tengchongensis TaxID=1073253 RepID=A0A840P0D6_9ACTN|nr:helix-turn-helix transcriptional regulator [Thermocatellispora tengchongensis]MBB5132449.1 transcriptional regulator with XRE-family HTH domain [Thermocatellispora tengchongensis]
MELVEQRRSRRWSQAALAMRLDVHQTLVSQWETGRTLPGREYVRRLDQIYGLTEDDTLVALYERVLREAESPRWFLRWAEQVEPQATTLKFWDPLLVPGILQTERYASAIFQAEPRATRAWIEERVAARMARRAILDKKRPPIILSLVEESVLHRPIGDRDVLVEQLRHLLRATERPDVNVQIVPTSAGCAAGMISGFALAQLPPYQDMATVEAAHEGLVTADADIVTRLHQRYDSIRTDAYSQRESLRIIKDAIERWAK